MVEGIPCDHVGEVFVSEGVNTFGAVASRWSEQRDAVGVGKASERDFRCSNRIGATCATGCKSHAEMVNEFSLTYAVSSF